MLIGIIVRLIFKVGMDWKVGNTHCDAKAP